MKAVALLILLGFCAVRGVSAQTGTLEVGADPNLHGPFPTNYQEIITEFLKTVLVDAPSAQIEWVTAPKPGTMPEKKGGNPLFGYLVEFKLNSRNRFGAYTGMQKKTVLIHDGQVIKAKGFGLFGQ
ncbi:MAG TPA: hypothetical protein VH252_07050 [Chthoniobacterales bacterium]|jgi:hypothetical protein|nr:hypothetical protein [Chthoniobacterales bacterium]